MEQLHTNRHKKHTHIKASIRIQAHAHEHKRTHATRICTKKKTRGNSLTLRGIRRKKTKQKTDKQKNKQNTYDFSSFESVLDDENENVQHRGDKQRDERVEIYARNDQVRIHLRQLAKSCCKKKKRRLIKCKKKNEANNEPNAKMRHT